LFGLELAVLLVSPTMYESPLAAGSGSLMRSEGYMALSLVWGEGCDSPLSLSEGFTL